MRENRLIHFAQVENRDTSEQIQGEQGEDESTKEKVGLLEEARNAFNAIPEEFRRTRMADFSMTEEWIKNNSQATPEAIRGVIESFKDSKNASEGAGVTQRQAESLLATPFTSDTAKKEIRDFLARYNAKQTTEDENKRFSEFVKVTFENQGRHAKAGAEYDTLLQMPGLKEAAAKVEVKLESKSQFGTNETLRGVIPAEKFQTLSAAQKEKYLGAVRGEYDRRVDNYDPSVVAKKDELKSRDDIPGAWKNWLEDKTTQEPLKAKVEWTLAHVPELKLQEAQFELKTADRATQKAFAKKGEQMPTLKKFQELTRDERESELGKLDAEKAKYEQEFGVEKSAAEAADQTKVEGGTKEMKDSAESQEKEEANKLKVILEQLKVSALYQQTQKLSEQKIARADDYAATEVGSIANLRSQAQQEGGGFFKNIGRMMGFDKKSADKEALESKEARAQTARASASNEVMGKKESQDEFKKIVGITPDKELKPGELERLAATFLSAKNLEDPREIKNALLANEEMRQLALRVANLDAQKMAA